MSEFPFQKQLCVLCPQQLTQQLHAALSSPDPDTYSELRLLAAARLQEMDAQQSSAQCFAIELRLLDLLAALSMCSPAEALAVYRKLDASLAVPLPDRMAELKRCRARYIGTVQMLQAQLAPWRMLVLPQLRTLALQNSGPDILLGRSLLLDALLSGERGVVQQAWLRLREISGNSSECLDLQLIRLCSCLLQNSAQGWMLKELLCSCHSFADWQILQGPLWERCLQARLLDHEAWRLHLEAHQRCHGALYESQDEQLRQDTLPNS